MQASDRKCDNQGIPGSVKLSKCKCVCLEGQEMIEIRPTSLEMLCWSSGQVCGFG